MTKPKPIGQRYKIGDRVYRKSPDLRANNSSFNARYGTITGVDSSPNAVGAVNYYYMVRWEGSSTRSSSKHMQARLLPADIPVPPDSCFDNIKEDYQNTLAEQAYEEEKIEAAFSSGEVETEPVQLFEDITDKDQ